MICDDNIVCIITDMDSMVIPTSSSHTFEENRGNNFSLYMKEKYVFGISYLWWGIIFSEYCLICYVEASGIHFGVRSCRACTAFFRRTVRNNFTYKCRFDNKCDVSQSKPKLIKLKDRTSYFLQKIVLPADTADFNNV